MKQKNLFCICYYESKICFETTVTAVNSLHVWWDLDVILLASLRFQPYGILTVLTSESARVSDFSPHVNFAASWRRIYDVIDDMIDKTLTLWHLAKIGDFREKNTETHVVLCRYFSSRVSATDLEKVANDVASFVVCTRKKFFGCGCGIFVSDIISGGLLGHRGPFYLALGSNCWMVVFRWSFHWKLGYNPSLFDTLDDLLGFQV